MAAKRAAATALTEEEDSQRSLAQWLRLDVASLRLKCNNYNITATGRKGELAERLFKNFAIITGSSSSSDDESSILESDAEAEDVSDASDEVATRNKSPTPSEHPSDEEEEEETLPPLDPDEEEMRALLSRDHEDNFSDPEQDGGNDNIRNSNAHRDEHHHPEPSITNDTNNAGTELHGNQQ